MPDAASRFLALTMESFGLDPARIATAGVSVCPQPDRAGTSVASAYACGAHIAIACDPAIGARITSVATSMVPNLDSWALEAEHAGGELLGSAVMLARGADGVRQRHVPDGFELVVLPNSAAAEPYIAQLMLDLSADDADDAELEEAPRDRHACVFVESDGRAVAYAGARPWERFAGYGDIGVAVAPSVRKRGVGMAVVAALCELMLDDGVEPLYRRNDDNIGSATLAANLGFVPSTRLTAYRF